LQPGGVDGEKAGREPAEAAVLAGADPVIDPGVAAVAQFQQLYGAVGSWGVGDEDLVAHAFDRVEQAQSRMVVPSEPGGLFGQVAATRPAASDQSGKDHGDQDQADDLTSRVHPRQFPQPNGEIVSYTG
jgi:hypothetical protein